MLIVYSSLNIDPLCKTFGGAVAAGQGYAGQEWFGGWGGGGGLVGWAVQSPVLLHKHCSHGKL